MNNRGYVTASVVFSVIIVSLLIMGLFYLPLLNSSYSMKQSFASLEDEIKSRNGIERIYSLLYQNIAHSEDVDYIDIGKKYQLIDKEVNYRKISLSNSYSSVGESSFSESFKIMNPTEVIIDLKFEGNIYVDEDGEEVEVGSYDVSIVHDKKGVLYESEVFDTDKVITIPESYLYNESQNNYGEYTIFINLADCSVDVVIEYDELSYRKIELVENEEYKRYLVIENNISINDSFEMYFVSE